MLGVRTLAVLPGPQELAEAVGDALLSRLRTLIEGTAPGRRINLAISGGAISSSLLPSLRGRVGEVDWSRVRVWFVDERYVAAGDPDRNDDQAWEGFFHAAAGVEFVRVPSRAPGCRGDDGLDAAALAFEDTWTSLMGDGSFDIALIGMGPDGHIASLFPVASTTRLARSSQCVTRPSLHPSASRFRCRSCAAARKSGWPRAGQPRPALSGKHSRGRHPIACRLRAC